MQGDGDQYSIHTAEPTGANPRPLIPSKSALAVFSPDGKRIAYLGEGGGDQPDLFVADADGKNPIQLTKTPDIEMGVHWSGDSKRVMFNRLIRDGMGEQLAGMEIFAVTLDGKSTAQLTTNQVADALPSGILGIADLRR